MYYIKGMRSDIKRLLLVVLAIGMIALSNDYHAFSQSLPLRHYSKKDGMIASYVVNIFQDSGGFLWISTHRGASRFDGIKFENFMNAPVLNGAYIWEIIESRDGDIWFATSHGGVLRYKNGRFDTFNTENGLISNQARALAEDHDGNIWIGTQSGISVFSPDRGSFVDVSREQGLNKDNIADILVDARGNVWLGTAGGVSRFQAGRFHRYTAADGLCGNDVKALAQDRQGNIWIGTGHGLCTYREGKFGMPGIKNGIADITVRKIIEDRKGKIWFATNDGLYSLFEGEITRYGSEQGLPNDNVFTVFADREQNIWFGTNKGLSKIQSLNISHYSTRNGLPHNYIWSIIEDKSRRYWIGTDNGLSCFSGGKCRNYTTSDGLAGNSIYTLLEDRDGKIWIGTNAGLSVYSAKKFRNYTEKEGLAHRIVTALLRDSSGVIWIGTVEGLCRFSGGRLSQPGFLRTAFPIMSLLEDKHKNIWVASPVGVFRMENGRTVHYTVENGLPDNSALSLFEDHGGRIWISTKKGLSCFDNGRFSNFTRTDGLADNYCVFVIEDDYDQLWIGTGSGLSKFDGKSYKNYTIRDGLTSLEMSEKACLKDSRGYLWFGTDDGLNCMNPRPEPMNITPPLVHITSMNISGETHSPPGSATFILEYNRNYITIDFVGIALAAPEDTWYRYRLQTIDENWFETHNREVSYPYLPPGAYTFQVKAINNNGIESPDAAEIKFKILPPFWQTWWFRLAAVGVFLAGVMMAVVWRMKRVREKVALRERNKQLVMAQKMELMGILAAGAVHDLKNLLSVIIAYSKLATKYIPSDEKGIQVVDTIKNTALTAVQVIKQVLAFARQKYDHTGTANLPDLVQDILEIIKVSASADVETRWVHPQKDILFNINPTKFQQILMNLCLNSLQAMPLGGILYIGLEEGHDNSILLTVSDTGAGMERDVLEKIFEPLFTTKEPGRGTGLGLFVVDQIVREYRGKIDVSSQPNRGTAFKITFYKSF